MKKVTFYTFCKSHNCFCIVKRPYSSQNDSKEGKYYLSINMKNNFDAMDPHNRFPGHFEHGLWSQTKFKVPSSAMFKPSYLTSYT